MYDGAQVVTFNGFHAYKTETVHLWDSQEGQWHFPGRNWNLHNDDIVRLGLVLLVVIM